jgi:integrase/recombinase XerD
MIRTRYHELIFKKPVADVTDNVAAMPTLPRIAEEAGLAKTRQQLAKPGNECKTSVCGLSHFNGITLMDSNSIQKIDYLIDFKTYLTALNRSQQTISSYIYNIKRYLDYLSTTGVLSAVNVSCSDIEKYQAHLLSQPDHTLPTVDAYMRSVRGYYKYLVRQEIIISNPADLVPLPKMPRQLPRNVLTEKEIDDLLKQPDVKTDEGVLHRAILELFYSAGLRLNELCQLKLDDVDTSAGFVRVIQGKGNKDRNTPIGNSACLWVRAYRELIRPKLEDDPSGNILFLGSRDGYPIHPVIVQQFVRRYAKQAGITKKVSPHILRSTCATHLLKNGMSLMQVREILGHQLVTTTQRYTQITPTDLIAAHKRFHPRDKQ